MKVILLGFLLLVFPKFIFAQPETEPNNTFETANALDIGVSRSGIVGNATGDQYDYFRAIFPTDGTLVINISATNNHSSNGYIYMYGYDRRKGSGQVLSKYVGNTSNVAVSQGISDVIKLYGRAADTFYIRLEAPGNFSYNLSYNLADVSPNDVEPNNTFAESLSINRLEEKLGHIGYVKNGGADNNDFYRTVLPYDGTLRIFVKGTNRSGSSGYMYMYGYDRRMGNGQILSKYITNSSNITNDSTIYDTINIYGRAADTVYFNITSAGAFAYSLKYDIVDSIHNDTEPNNSFEESIIINRTEEKKGLIGYVKNGSPDSDDYYRTVFPYDGTLKIYVQGTNRSGSSGYMYMYGYDRRKGSGQALSKYIANTSNVGHNTTIYDTIYLHGRAADTFYFRMTSAGAFSYTLRYDIVDTSQNDIEPNDNFEEPILTNQLDEKKGHIGYVKNGDTDASDFYKTVVPIDGTLKIYIQGRNRSGGNGYMYLYGYDRRKAGGQVFSTYVSGSSNIKPDSTIYDTITIYGVLADTFYFRVTSAGAFSYQISYNTIVNSLFDPEPNNTFEESIEVRQGILQNGQIGYTLGGNRDNYDYYVTNLPTDGTMKIIIQGTNNSGSSGYLYMYGYDRRKGGGQVLAKYIGNNSNVAGAATIYDTIYLFGRASDTFYFRIESAQPFSYNFSYDIIDTSENDVEPNGTFEQSIPITFLEEKKGHIGYVKSGVGDADDFYRTVMPHDGTVKLIVKGTNKSGTSGYMYVYGYDGRKGNGQILSKYVANNSNVAHDASVYDTINLFGRAADTVYFRIVSAGAFSYSIKYDISDSSENDVEPNGTFEQSIPITFLEEKKGHIGYVKFGSPDVDDFYRTVLPHDGTIKLIVKGNNKSGTSGFLYIYGYDGRKGNGQILSKYVANNSNVAHDTTVYDTIYLFGRAADTMYFRITSAGAFSYSIKYDLSDTSENDVEPNNTFAQSIAINHLQEKKGHIGYVKYGAADAFDYYRAVLPSDGTLKIYVQGRNRNGTAGYMYIYGYDSRQGSGQILSKYVSGSSNIKADSTIYDTIYLHGRAADTTYFAINSAGAFSYSLKYEMKDTGDSDLEPNNTFAQALPMAHKEVKKGHIGYVQSGVGDGDDFYVTKLPYDGTLKIMVQGMNRSGANGYMYMYGYDRRQGGGQILSKYIANSSNIKNDSTIYDTIYISCRAVDTVYFRMQSAGAFTYMLSYEMVDTSQNDLEPNNTFDTAIPIMVDEVKSGHIGYVQSGVGDADDYYRAVLPAKGTFKIVTQITNTSGASGYVYVYGYDKRKGSGQILARYIANTGNVPANETITDTFTINCATIDTFYYRLISAGCFRYSVKLLLTSLQPKADFEYTRVGNTFGFQKNPNSNGTSFLWDLGNGTTTANTEPSLTTYLPGFYTAKLIARNNTGSCLFTDTAKRSFTVEGIEKYTPHVSGPGNVFFTVYGGGLDTNFIFKLTQGSNVYIDSATRVNQYGNIYNCIVDLHNAPLGFYNVEIRKGSTVYSYPNGFKVEALVDKLRVDIVGNQNIRTGINNLFTIRVHNDGNTMTGLSKVYMLTAPNITVTSLDSSLPLPSNPYALMDTIPHVLQVTTAQDFPINGNLRGMVISGIPPGGFQDLRFTFNFQAGVSDVYVWSSGPISGSPDRPWLSDCWKARLKWAYSVGNYGLDLVPVVDCGWGVAKTVFSGLNFLGNAILGGFSSGYDAGGAYASLAKTGLGAMKNCAGEASVFLTGPGALAIEAADMGTDILANSLSVNAATQEWIDKCEEEKKDKQKKKTDARNSWDPNAKTGPGGIGANGYINGSEKLMTYGIFFENLATAGLPAQNVTIIDTINKNVYDLKSFKLESFGIGEKVYYISAEKGEYTAVVNLNTQLALKAWMKLDTATGVFTTNFITIDRATGDTTTNQLAGFLPPNVNSPEGQGVITYSINMKSGMSDGTQLNNKAKIIFDTNEPIITNLWKNTLDILPPSSIVTSVTAISDTSATIAINGSDATSGVEYYMLYVSLNNGPFIKSGYVRSLMTFYGRVGANYRFYSVAVDSVGNVESKTPAPEGSITFPGVFPITLISVSADNEGERNRIAWVTATEDKGDFVEIERSSNARTFEWMSTVPARGTASGYTTYDNNAPYGRTYYRLKMVNADGKFGYSKVVSAYRTSKGEFVMDVFPNPAKNIVVLNLNGDRTGKATVQVMSMTGLILKRMDILQNKTEIDISNLAAGVYFIKYADGNRTEVVRIVKN